MLSKKRRILRKEFPKILSKGKKYNSLYLIVYITPVDLKNKNHESKFSFSISKKICPLSVDRNKFRRWGYSIINRHTNKIKIGYLCFFSFKKGSSQLSFDTLEKEILELLSESNMLK